MLPLAKSLINLHLISDGVIALSYFSIPFAISFFLSKRKGEFQMRGVLALFAGFILSCGLTHVMAMWNLWNSDYWQSGVIKAATATISFATAILLWKLMPKILRIPSPETYKLMNDQLVNLNRNLEDEIERRTAELTMRNESAAHSSRLASLGEMAGGIAHEINTPLSIIKLKARQLRKTLRNADAAGLEKSLDDISVTVDRIAEIILGLKRIARDSSGDPVDEMNAKDVLSLALSLSRQRLSSKGILLVVDYEDIELPKIYGNMNQFAEVIINILNNGCYALKSQKDPMIRISFEDSHEELTMKIFNNGPGISKEVSEKIFDLFFTTKPVGQGTGLGLSISKQIMRKYGGNLELAPVSNGVCFRVSFSKSGDSLELKHTS